MQESGQPIPYGMHLVVRPARDGRNRVTIHKTNGYDFHAIDEASGFVLGAAAMHHILGSIRMPGTWHQVLNALISLQARARPGYVVATHRQLINDFKIPNGHIGEAMSYFQDVGWIRLVKGGVYQLNPFLMFRGNSGTQPALQKEWLECTGNRICYIPNFDHPAEWRREREASKNAGLGADKRGQLDLLGDRAADGSPPATHAQAATGPAETTAIALDHSPGSEDTVGRRLARARSTTERVRIAYAVLGPKTTPAMVEELLRNHQLGGANRETVKSALARIRRAG